MFRVITPPYTVCARCLVKIHISSFCMRIDKTSCTLTIRYWSYRWNGRRKINPFGELLRYTSSRAELAISIYRQGELTYGLKGERNLFRLPASFYQVLQHFLCISVFFSAFFGGCCHDWKLTSKTLVNIGLIQWSISRGIQLKEKQRLTKKCLGFL